MAACMLKQRILLSTACKQTWNTPGLRSLTSTIIRAENQRIDQDSASRDRKVVPSRIARTWDAAASRKRATWGRKLEAATTPNFQFSIFHFRFAVSRPLPVPESMDHWATSIPAPIVGVTTLQAIFKPAVGFSPPASLPPLAGARWFLHQIRSCFPELSVFLACLTTAAVTVADPPRTARLAMLH
jgi:hypothetical protein